MKFDLRTYGHMLQEYYVRRFREVAAARAEARANIRTPGQVMALRAEVRRKLRRCFGPFPARTPLNCRVTGVVRRRDYVIEKMLFESRPGLLVSSNLYRPRRGSGPFPAVLVPCGHSSNGKAYALYQAVAQHFARMGYIVLIYDPVSQGERLQYPEYRGHPPMRGCCQEHNMMGNQMGLLGQFFGAWRVWDGIRALDCLLSLSKVDATRVGVTGQSGGGTLTTYLNAFDDRFAMAAPSCFVTSYLHDMENELPADSEQMPPGILAAGLDQADFFVAQIPRPTILLGQNNDYFDRRGLEKTYAELKRLYTILGRPDNVQLSIGPCDHSFSAENRQAVYRFFNRVAKVKASWREPHNARPEKDHTLWATPRGQVHFLGARRVFDFTRETAAEIAHRRRPLDMEELCRAITRRLTLPKRAGAPYYRVLRIQKWPGKMRRLHCALAIETEPGIQAILHMFPEKGALYHLPRGARAVLYVPHLSAEREFEDGLAPDARATIFALEPRGIGRVMARSCSDDDFFAPYDSDYFYASNSLMLGESYCGQRVHDLLCALDLLEANGYRSIHLVGRGLGAIWAACAACLHPVVRRVTLYNALLSWHELTQTPVQRWPLSAMPFGVLRDFDLPDIYRALKPKRLRLLEPWDVSMRPMDAAAARQRLKEMGLARG